MRRIAIFGATSAIGHALARKLAGTETTFFLCARNPQKLELVKQDLTGRGAKIVSVIPCDLKELGTHGDLVAKASGALGQIDVAIICHGELPKKEQSTSAATIESCAQTNFISAASLMEQLAAALERQKTGSIVVISSVAGDRGRRSNYLYGATKAALDAFASGLRARLGANGVHVMTVKPGLVDTPMTKGFAKGALWASPDAVANDIARGIRKKKDVLYTPAVWRWIMLVIRLLPEVLFKRIKI